MSLYQSLYFMSLVGGIAGLLAWAMSGLISSITPGQGQLWIPDMIAAMLLGGLIGGMTVAFGDRWSGNRILTRWVVSGSLIGMVAGVLAGVSEIPLTAGLTELPTVSRISSWMLTGALIGLGLGVRWITVNRTRAAHALVGGMVGGLLGGSIFAGLGSRIPDFSQAFSFMLVGSGISFGITFAPILLRDGVLQFISSGDPQTQSKYGRTRKQWEVQDGDSYVIGNGQKSDMSMSRYRPDVEISIPDASIALRHARLFGKDGRFFLSRHPDISSEAGLRRYILKVGAETIMRQRELRDQDDILIGRTALVFQARRQKSKKRVPTESRR